LLSFSSELFTDASSSLWTGNSLHELLHFIGRVTPEAIGGVSDADWNGGGLFGRRFTIFPVLERGSDIAFFVCLLLIR